MLDPSLPHFCCPAWLRIVVKFAPEIQLRMGIDEGAWMEKLKANYMLSVFLLALLSVCG